MTRSTAAAKFRIGDVVICIADSAGIDAAALKDQFGAAWKHQVVSGVVTDIVAGDGRLPDHYFVDWDVGGSKKRAQVTARALRTRETLGRVRVRGRQIPRTLGSGTGAGTDEKPRVRGTPLTLEGVPRLADLLISVRGRVMQLPGCRVGPKAA